MNSSLVKLTPNERLKNLPEGFSLHDIPSDENEEPQLKDFVSCAPENKCIFRPTGEMWTNSAVDSRIPPVPTGTFNKNGEQNILKASLWLAQNQSVEQLSWVPGEPQLIENSLVLNGTIRNHIGNTVFNLYRPPEIRFGDPTGANPWVDHIRTVYPENTDHILNWFAHRVQQPGAKINHAIIMGGAQGIGKDTILEPLSMAVGPWNFSDVTPSQLLGRFNGFIKSVVLRVSEARDMGDTNRYAFYDHLKIYTASPPDVLRVDEIHRNEYGIKNVCGVIITTNYKSGAIYLPADDRRHYVAWSEKTKSDFDESYWVNLWGWYVKSGFEDIAAFLKARDLSKFDPKAPPEKTPAFWEIVDASRAPEDAEMADALEKLGDPDAVTIPMIISVSAPDFAIWLSDRKNFRKIPHRLEEAGYTAVQNPDAKSGRWRLDDARLMIYSKKEFSIRRRIEAANKLVSGGDLL